MEHEPMRQVIPQEREEINIEEVFKMLGEHQLARYRMGQQIERLMKQIGEMSKEIERLRSNMNSPSLKGVKHDA